MIQLELTKPLNFSTGEGSLNLKTTIQSGSFVALYGKSGAGKTTILRIIAGLMPPQTGKIVSSNDVWFDSTKKINQTPQQRNVGFVFQDYALFPNMTVLENLTFALKKGQSTAIINELIQIMELNGLKQQYPRFLSGGQQQRVALARALVQRPKILLLDEPLSALDSTLRTVLQSYLIKVHQRYELTTIMVSHDQEEILSMANRVLVLENGKIINDTQPTLLFKTSNLESIDLEGIILSIQNNKATVKIGSNIIETKLSNLHDYKIGDNITLPFLKK